MIRLYHDDKIFAMPDLVKEPVVQPRLWIVNTAHHDIGRLQRLRDQVFKHLPGGRIAVESHPGQGTTMRLHLPIAV